MKDKSMTIDTLARMVQKGFEGNKAQMEGMEDRISHELRAIRKELVGVVHRDEFEDLQERVRDLEEMLAMPTKKAA